MSSTPPAVARVIALGASNLTRGFHTVVTAARCRWGADVEVLAALGHGRSYGVSSRVLIRTLPAILDCDLWPTLDRLPPAPTRALVTDIGNDILYGSSAAQLLAWVDGAVDRLRRVTADIVVMDLPMRNVRRLSRAKFAVFRALFFPGHAVRFEDVVDAAERVSEGLARLAVSRQLMLVDPKPDWYGVDPIHIRPSQWRRAWQEILCGESAAPLAPGSRMEALRLYCLPPQRRWLCGIEQVAPQHGTRLRAGGRVWVY